MKIKRLTYATLLLAGVCALARAETKPAADLIIIDARVWTVDAEKPEAEAIAILGERIVAVGSDEEIAAWRGPHTKVIAGQGRRVLPGFNDSHVHFMNGGQQLENVALRDAASPEEFARRIGKHAAKLDDNEWVVGGNWDHQLWKPAKLPNRRLIDPLTPNTPVFVNRSDGHMGLANSAALRLAGITADTPAPPGGVIEHDARGEPTGILKDAAMGLVQKLIPPVSRDAQLRSARLAMRHAANVGVTSVQHMSCEYEHVSVYAELAERGELTTRIYAAPRIASWREQAQVGMRRAFGSSRLRLGALKGFADGSLGAGTAYFFKPYTDEADNRGLLADDMLPTSQMLERMTRADAAALQLCIHGIGDRAISEVLDLFARVRRVNGPRDRRFRVEHAQHVAPQDFARFHELDVIASMQPYHAIDDGRWAEGRIGPVRAQGTYAFRTFLESDVRLAFGTDWPVAPLNPLYTVYAAVTRATIDGRRNEGWVPEQKITVAETIEAYTLGSAYAEFQEHEKGSIEVGKLADVVILQEDIFNIPPMDIVDVLVDMTIVGGRVVWDRFRSR